MSNATPLENRLFRLCMLLKLAFWAALLAILARLLWATVTGGELPRPAPLIGVVGGLATVQLAAVIAWWRVRRARLRGNAR